MDNYYKLGETETETKDHENETIMSSVQISLPSIPSVEEIGNITSTKDLIYRLKQSNLGLTENDFDVLKYHKIIGRTFLMLTEEKLESRGVKLGPALNIIYSINKIRDRNSSLTLDPSLPTRMSVDDDQDEIDILREDFREIVNEKFRIASGLSSKVNLSLLVKDVYRVCGEDTISAKTLRDFYSYKTNLSKHTYPIIERWVEHKKRINNRNNRRYKTWF
ncbi:hypothetical protein RclHR1_01650017 [Rhizophagus clarus]|uniref:SAM domain-containing protein n=1 Tax=Rhizophagus clarus TaxID=94130 RepID=A0A2Z6QI28_9GLOM|nr:hypothetical protein RclHR1_01650017 [Rhizophagus clarus]